MQELFLRLGGIANFSLSCPIHLKMNNFKAFIIDTNAKKQLIDIITSSCDWSQNNPVSVWSRGKGRMGAEKN